MAVIIRVEGLQSLLHKLRQRAAKLGQDTRRSVVVGYSQNYAIYVHENLQAHHPVGQAKFLEQPARTEQGQIGAVIAQAFQRGRTLLQSVLMGGLYLQRVSQKLCPVDTGALRNSAFTRVE